MRNLQDVTERVCELKGSLVALDALLSAMLLQLSPQQLAALGAAFQRHAEVARTVLLNADISDGTLAAFERDVVRTSSLIESGRAAAAPPEAA